MQFIALFSCFDLPVIVLCTRLFVAFVHFFNWSLRFLEISLLEKTYLNQSGLNWIDLVALTAHQIWSPKVVQAALGVPLRFFLQRAKLLP